MADNDTLLNPFGEKDYPEYDRQLEFETMWVSECCTAYPIGELDMSSVPFGGPSGFCGRCHDNCIFIVEDMN